MFDVLTICRNNVTLLISPLRERVREGVIQINKTLFLQILQNPHLPFPREEEGIGHSDIGVYGNDCRKFLFNHRSRRLPLSLYASQIAATYIVNFTHNGFSSRVYFSNYLPMHCFFYIENGFSKKTHAKTEDRDDKGDPQGLIHHFMPRAHADLSPEKNP